MGAAADLMRDHAVEARSRLAAPSASNDYTARRLAIAEAKVCAILAVADAIQAQTRVIEALIDGAVVEGGQDIK